MLNPMLGKNEGTYREGETGRTCDHDLIQKVAEGKNLSRVELEESKVMVHKNQNQESKQQTKRVLAVVTINTTRRKTLRFCRNTKKRYLQDENQQRSQQPKTARSLASRAVLGNRKYYYTFIRNLVI